MKGTTRPGDPGRGRLGHAAPQAATAAAVPLPGAAPAQEVLPLFEAIDRRYFKPSAEVTSLLASGDNSPLNQVWAIAWWLVAPRRAELQRPVRPDAPGPDRQPLRTDAWMAAERFARRSVGLAAFGNGRLQTAPVELAPAVIYERRDDQHATPSDA
ncbi:hypothetical protein [Streptomyces sp. NPDC048248]|uniref:hypothetical protein n=1 Tax=Streptomyces sp. NPDC048248 TaxID=3365523 RepID=UPI0037104A56